MYSHLFIKWYGRQPTRFQEAVISLLERHRWHNGGHIRACIDTTGAPIGQLESILCSYLRFLRETYTPWGDVIIADRTRPLAQFRQNASFSVNDRSVHALSGRTRFGTRRGVQATQAIAFNLHNYGSHLNGDPRARDTITNLLNTVPHCRGSAVILVGRYRSNCLSFFARYYYTMRMRHAAATGEAAAVLPLCAAQAINERQLLKLKWLNKLKIRAGATALAERNKLRAQLGILSRRSLELTACGHAARDSLRAQPGITCGQRPQLTALAQRNKLCRKIAA